MCDDYYCYGPAKPIKCRFCGNEFYPDVKNDNYNCTRCGKEHQFNFQKITCMAAETHFDEHDTSKVEQLEKNEQHPHYVQHWIEFKGNEHFLIGKCEASNEVLLKYAKWVEDVNNVLDTLKNEQFEDYVCSRLENIHNILMPFFIEGFINNENYGNYIEYNNKLLDNLEKELNSLDKSTSISERIGLLVKCNEMIEKCIEQVLNSLNK